MPLLQNCLSLSDVIIWGTWRGSYPPTSPHPSPSATVEIAPLLLGHSLRPAVIEPTTSAKTQNGGLMVQLAWQSLERRGRRGQKSSSAWEPPSWLWLQSIYHPESAAIMNYFIITRLSWRDTCPRRATGNSTCLKSRAAGGKTRTERKKVRRSQRWEERQMEKQTLTLQ